MARLIAGINMTLDGIFDHNSVNADEELHQHYYELIAASEIILYGRKTYQLMEYWKSVVENPVGQRATDDFAIAINKISKIVFSRTLKNLDWNTAILAGGSLEEEARKLKEQHGNDVLVGSRSLIIQLLKAGLVDEVQICIHPILAGEGSFLFDEMKDQVHLNLINTKELQSGAIVLYYKPESSKPL